MRILTLTLVLSASLLGCPPKQEEKLGPCQKMGERCEVSPGKLGTCVVVDGCKSPPCGFDCQSQH
ncbi:MAG: hypothetical protein U0270_46515 [Labilithrix sp.]